MLFDAAVATFPLCGVASMDEPVIIKPSWQKKFVNDVEDFAIHATIGGATLLFFLAALTLVIQVYQYLKTGAWPHWVLFGVLMKDLPGPFVQWIVSPTDWLGLHKIVWWILLECPTWLIALILAGVWLACGGIVIMWLDALSVKIN
jgi:hypothetical protein